MRSKIRGFSEDDVPENWPASLTLANGVVLVVSTIAQAQGDLLPAEQELLDGARPMRRREIIAGRTMARHAMSELEIAPAAILMDCHGAPTWPSGLCGSIAHSPQHIAVSVSRIGDLQSLGIDIEDGRDLDKATSDIASAADIAAILAASLTQDHAAAARMVFSAKEALFKCQAPVTGNTDLEFGEVGLWIDADGVLRGRFLPSEASNGMSRLQDVRVYFIELQGVMIPLATLSGAVQRSV